jgi:hypothetical protein
MRSPLILEMDIGATIRERVGFARLQGAPSLEWQPLQRIRSTGNAGREDQLRLTGPLLGTQ